MITEHDQHQEELDFGETYTHTLHLRDKTVQEHLEEVARDIVTIVQGEQNTPRAVIECLIIDKLKELGN